MNRNPVQLVFIAAIVAAVGSLCAWMMLDRPATGIDDADIFFVYARNMAEGHGFVYNIGGERVEGFTSLLWTLICTGLFRFTERVEIPLYLLNVLFGALTIHACLKRVQRPAFFLFLLAAAPAWFAWCQVSLMETGLWCCLLVLALLAAVERRGMLFTFLLPLLVVTRPESMLWCAWLIPVFGRSVTSEEGWRSGLKKSVVPAAVFAIALLVLVAFRMIYFGYPFPNTYYAKVSPSIAMNLWLGSGYLLKYLFLNPAVLLAVILWILMLLTGLLNRRSRTDQPMLIAVALLPGIFIPILVGGDHFGGSRFYQPIWPLLCLLAVEGCPGLLGRFKPLKARLLLLVLVLFGWVLFPFTAMLKHEFRIAQTGRRTGTALTVMFAEQHPYPTVAVITAGGSKYAYPGTVLDLMGLNATVMAHTPGARAGYKNHTAFNREIFYAWHPDILLCGEDAEFDAYVLKGLQDEEQFRQRYVRLALQRNGQQVDAYYSHAFLKRLQQTAQ
jgi:hypothetical protein